VVGTGRAGVDDVTTFLAAELGSVVVSLVVGAFVWSAAVFVAVQDAAGRPAGPLQGLRFAARRAVPLMGWWLLAMLLVAIGTIMLVVPGLVLTVLFYGSLLGVVVVERRGIGRSIELSMGRFWPTAGRLVVAGLVWQLVAVAADRIGGGFTDGVVGALAQAGLMLVVAQLLTGVAVVTYAELRSHDGGCTTSTLAEELGVHRQP
jgi:hypothetical protein